MAPRRGESGYLTRYPSRLLTSVALSFPAWRTRTCNSASGSKTASLGSVAASSLLGFAGGCDAAGDFLAGAFPGGAAAGGGACWPQAMLVMINATKSGRSRFGHRIGAIVSRNRGVRLEKRVVEYSTRPRKIQRRNHEYRYFEAKPEPQGHDMPCPYCALTRSCLLDMRTKKFPNPYLKSNKTSTVWRSVLGRSKCPNSL